MARCNYSEILSWGGHLWARCQWHQNWRPLFLAQVEVGRVTPNLSILRMLMSPFCLQCSMNTTIHYELQVPREDLHLSVTVMPMSVMYMSVQQPGDSFELQGNRVWSGEANKLCYFIRVRHTYICAYTGTNIAGRPTGQGAQTCNSGPDFSCLSGGRQFKIETPFPQGFQFILQTCSKIPI